MSRVHGGIEALEPRRLLAAAMGGAELFADVDPSTAGTFESFTGGTEVVEVGGVYYFIGQNAATGREIWRSDGTAAGTRVLKDIQPGPGSSSPERLSSVNGTLYFLCADPTGPTNSQRIWKSDGTEAGTVPVARAPFHSSNLQGFFFGAGGIAYFVVRETFTTGVELWRTDGTEAGTHILKDINPGTGSSSPHAFVEYDGELFFTADDGVKRDQLWRTDGTEAGTLRVTQLNTAAGGLSPGAPVVFDGHLYFIGYGPRDLSSGTTFQSGDLWKSDGTAQGTQRVYATVPYMNSDLARLAVVGDRLMFVGRVDSNRYGLYASDGTAAGTALVKDFFTTTHSGFQNFVDVDGKAVFQWNGELWRSDGTGLGTYALLGSYDARWSFTAVTSIGDKGLILGRSLDTTAGLRPIQLYVTDGDPGAGHTFALTDAARDARLIAAGDGQALFFNFTWDTGYEPWVTDGTAAGTAMVADTNTAPNSSAPSQFVRSGNSLYFTASIATLSGTELWRVDGATGDAVLVKDLVAGVGGSAPRRLTDVNGTLYFAALLSAQSTQNFGLFRTDGTAAGTVQVGGTLYNPENFLNVDGTLYFTASASGFAGYGLYKVAPGDAAPVLVSSIAATPTPSSFAPLAKMTRFGDALFFRAGNPSTTGDELWKYDLVAGGAAAMLKDIAPGIAASNPDNFAIAGGQLFFTAAGTTSAGTELWKTDGTPDGTVMVKNINTSAGFNGSSAPSYLIEFGGRLMFAAIPTGDSSESELWVSDGTAAGTVMVEDIRPGPRGSIPRNLTHMGEFVLFEARDDGGAGLWRSDGTAAGTFLVKRIGFLLGGSSSPQQFINADGRLFFRASDSGGAGLFTSDGTAAGTQPVAGVAPGRVPSAPRDFAVFDGGMYFAARSPDVGEELWRVALDAPFTLTPAGALLVSGTSAADRFTLAADATHITATRDGQTLTVPIASIASIVVSGLGESDTLDVNGTIPLPLTFNGNAGGAAGDTLNFLGGSNVLAADLGGASTRATLNVAAGASVEITATQHLARLSVAGSAALAPGGKVTLLTASLDVAGRLDLRDNDLIVDYDDASPIGHWVGAGYTGITGLVQSGRNGGTWDGSGIFSSLAAARGGLTTLGINEAAAVLQLAPGATATWSGHAVDSTAVIVKYTYAGDANLDGAITGDDYSPIDFGILFPGMSGYFNGDFDYDGVITGDDYAVIDLNILLQGAVL